MASNSGHSIIKGHRNGPQEKTAAQQQRELKKEQEEELRSLEEELQATVALGNRLEQGNRRREGLFRALQEDVHTLDIHLKRVLLELRDSEEPRDSQESAAPIETPRDSRGAIKLVQKKAAASADVAAKAVKAAQAQEALRAQWPPGWGGIAGPTTTASPGAPGALMASTEAWRTNRRDSEEKEDVSGASEGEVPEADPESGEDSGDEEPATQGQPTITQKVEAMEQRIAFKKETHAIYSDPRFGYRSCLWNPTRSRTEVQQVRFVPNRQDLWKSGKKRAAAKSDPKICAEEDDDPVWKIRRAALLKEQKAQIEMGIIEVIPHRKVKK